MALAAAGLAVVGLFFVQAATAQPVECDTLLTPAPAQPIRTPRPSFTPEPTPTPAETPAATATESPAATSEQTPGETLGESPAATAVESPAETPAESPAATPEETAAATAGETPGETAEVPSPSPASPTPVPSPTQQLGFTPRDLGAGHVRSTERLEYAYCPPTSGRHFEAPDGPIRRAFYRPQQPQSPGGWVHNLEHGWVVALYRCENDVCPSEEEMDELERFFEEVPATEKAQRCQAQNRVLVARFDQMATKFALVAWDRAMPVDDFDVEQAITFAEQWMDHEAVPEAEAC